MPYFAAVFFCWPMSQKEYSKVNNTLGDYGCSRQITNRAGLMPILSKLQDQIIIRSRIMINCNKILLER